MTTPTPKDASAMRTALVELPHPASTTPPPQPPRLRSSSPELRCPSSTTPTTRRRLAALTAALHTGLRELAAVAHGGLDTLPAPNPYPKDPSS